MVRIVVTFPRELDALGLCVVLDAAIKIALNCTKSKVALTSFVELDEARTF
jgi:hypothetical protein